MSENAFAEEEQASEKEKSGKKPTSFKKEVVSWALTLAVALVVVFVVDAFVAKAVIVQSVSMNDTLVENDRLLALKLYGEIKSGDIVVFHNSDTKDFIKRVVATGGDKIDIDFEKGEVYVNDKLINEPYIKQPTRVRLDFEGPVIVPEGYLFVMGDNRNHSNDSRDKNVGLISEEKVFGKVIFRFYPFDKIGSLN